MSFAPHWRARAESPEAVAMRIESGDRIFIHGACATPTTLIRAMSARADLERVQLHHLHTAGDCDYVAPSAKGRFFSNSLFTGEPCRKPIEASRSSRCRRRRPAATSRA